MTFLHMMIRVKDIKKSLKFYRDVFELDMGKEMRLSDCSLYFLKDKNSTTQIELTYNDKTPEEGYTKGTGFGHMAFEVNFEEFDARLRKLGIQYTYPPTKLDNYNMKIAFIEDPDGYEIELVENL